MKRLFAVVLVLVVLTGCPTVVVNQRDDATIAKFKQLRSCYLQDLATSISDEANGVVVDPADLGADTEFAGDLTWDEVDATLGVFDAAVAYEEAKQNPDDEDEDGEAQPQQ